MLLSLETRETVARFAPVDVVVETEEESVEVAVTVADDGLELRLDEGFGAKFGFAVLVELLPDPDPFPDPCTEPATPFALPLLLVLLPPPGETEGTEQVPSVKSAKQPLD